MKTNNINRPYSELFAEAMAENASWIAVDTLGAWFERYGQQYWNGECYSVDDSADISLYPVYGWEYNELSIIHYTFDRWKMEDSLEWLQNSGHLRDEPLNAESRTDTYEWTDRGCRIKATITTTHWPEMDADPVAHAWEYVVDKLLVDGVETPVREFRKRAVDWTPSEMDISRPDEEPGTKAIEIPKEVESKLFAWQRSPLGGKNGPSLMDIVYEEVD